MTTWDDIASELLRRVAKTTWCTLATVDAAGRARTRVVHPVWHEGEVWLATRSGTPKLDHLRRAPGVSLLWWDPDHEQVTVDGLATIHADDDTRRQAWQVFRAPAEPYGWDPAAIWPLGPSDDTCTIVRIRPDRVSLFGRPPVTWRSASPRPVRGGR